MVAYASNPLINGTARTGALADYTAQDIWVAAEDNTHAHARQITGRGLLDNTAITPILADFMQLTLFAATLSTRGGSVGPLAMARVR